MKIRRIAYTVLGVFIFFLAIVLLKESTGLLSSFFKSYLSSVSDPVSSLGLGWVLSYLMLSGSPVAALSLDFLSIGVLEQIPVFMMLVGSRLGAAFILILIGVVEYYRGKSDDLADSTSLAFLTFIITYTVFIPVIFIGSFFLGRGLGEFPIYSPGSVVLGINSFFKIFTDRIIAFSGSFPSFLLSFILLWIGLSVFDRAFKNLDPRRVKSSFIAFAMRRKWFSFFLGAVVTLFAASVSLSLGILVPLYNKGFVERRSLIPYIMGANITTFADTFIVAMLLESSLAFNVVLAAAVAGLIVTVIYLHYYHYYFMFLQSSINYLLFRSRRMIVFFILLLVIPLVLLFNSQLASLVGLLFS